MFEVKAKDGLGRIGKFQVGKKAVETPTIMPVINPGKVVVSPAEMKEQFGTDIIITNSYIIHSSPRLREKALAQGVHRLLDYEGIIVTDSGSFQLMQYRDVDVTNSDIIRFQGDIGVDVATSLDIPTLPDTPYAQARRELETTIARAKEARELRDGYLNGTVQGSTHMRLRRASARAMAAMDFEVHPIGAVVPLFLDYRFKDVVDIVLTAKQELSPAKPVHLFGAGHPMALSLFVLLGCDLFDSAAYVLYARDNRYLTVSGTKKLEEMAYLPCRCPVCRRHTPQSLLALPPEKRVRELSLHNLHVTYEEFARIRQAIHEGSLWDYVEMRVRGHPKLYFAFKEVSKYRRFIQAYDPLVKRSTPFYTGIESRSRPVFATARARASERLPAPAVTLRHPLFGAMPASLCHTYPFNVEMGEEYYADVDEDVMIRELADYQYGRGVGARLFDGGTVSYSRTDRVRSVTDGTDVIATLRARDGLFILGKAGQERLHRILPAPTYRVVVDNEVAPFVKERGDVFAKFVRGVDPSLYAGEEVLVVDEDDTLLGSGWLQLAPREIPFFSRGIAVRTRRGAGE
ncbi:MAG: tRNA guanosine(15) transglycosylase TgtA [Candidatus Methanofastidiosa archaeon]|nr:tRNA guanosine(15) transglycosylase TgtA [Candidatus Methanofastidiosa archaeon]